MVGDTLGSTSQVEEKDRSKSAQVLKDAAEIASNWSNHRPAEPVIDMRATCMRRCSPSTPWNAWGEIRKCRRRRARCSLALTPVALPVNVGPTKGGTVTNGGLARGGESARAGAGTGPGDGEALEDDEIDRN